MALKGRGMALLLVALPLLVALASCGRDDSGDAAAGAPPAPRVVSAGDTALFTADHPEQFPLTGAVARGATSELVVTGTVTPDVSRQVPVPSPATGRIVEIDARLGDQVKKGQLLFKVRSTDIAGAFSTYRQAIKNEELSKIQLTRANILFDNGAAPRSAQEIAENTEANNQVLVETAKEQLQLLGSDPDHPTGIVPVFAPVAGTITDQQVANQAGVQALASPTPFTISDLSHVWVVCDVYENDLSSVHLGDTAEIRLNAYPGKVFTGRAGNIGTILDPTIRTAKVRIEVENPGIMRVGMFVSATFHGQAKETHTVIPASAIMHMHDRDWVYVPAPGGQFRRVEVVGGDLLPGNVSMQEVQSGLAPGQQVVTKALVLDHVLSQ